MKNRDKQKQRKKRKVLKDLLPKGLKDWKKIPDGGRGPTTHSSTKFSA